MEMNREQSTLGYEELGYVMSETGLVKRKLTVRRVFLLVSAGAVTVALAAYILSTFLPQNHSTVSKKSTNQTVELDSTIRKHNVLTRLRMYADDCDYRSWKTDDLALERSIVLCREASAELELVNNNATRRELNTLLLRGILSLARQEHYRENNLRALQILHKARTLATDDMDTSLEKNYYLTAGAIETDRTKLANDLVNLLKLTSENYESIEELVNVNTMVGVKYILLNEPDKARICLDQAIETAKNSESAKDLETALKWKLFFLEKCKANSSEIKRLKKQLADAHSRL